MGKYSSGRVKRFEQSGITSDRYEFLGLEQAEPDLGDPIVGVSSVGANPVPLGDQYVLIAVDGEVGKRYWVKSINQQGAGLQGTQGVQGPLSNFQGTQGNQGLQGIQGLDGAFAGQGIQGLQGLQGIQGTQGIQGLQATQGLQGLQATQGLQGLQATQGLQGIQGLQGLQGPLNNFQGLQGIQGSQGLQGLQGIQGLQGTQGLQGIQGSQGLQGLQGIQGSQGTQGFQGLQGTQSLQGVQGLSGISGVIITDDLTEPDETRYVGILSTTSGTTDKILIYSNKLTFNPSTGSLTSIDFNSASDEDLKYNIKEIENSIEKILHLKGVSFNWKGSHNPSLGVIAQDIEKVLPELVFTVDGKKTVNYNGLIGLLISAVKELNDKIEKIGGS